MSPPGTLDRAVHGGPGRVEFVPRFFRPIMRGLHAHNVRLVLLDRGRAALDVHLVHDLLQSAVHPVGDNVEEGHHADFGMVNDGLFQAQKGVRTAAAGIHGGGDAPGEEKIRGNPKGRSVSNRGRLKPVERRPAVTHVNVNVHQARRHGEAADVHDLSGVGGGDVFFNSGNLSARNRDVHLGVHLVGRI